MPVSLRRRCRPGTAGSSQLRAPSHTGDGNRDRQNADAPCLGRCWPQARAAPPGGRRQNVHWVAERGAAAATRRAPLLAARLGYMTSSHHGTELGGQSALRRSLVATTASTAIAARNAPFGGAAVKWPPPWPPSARRLKEGTALLLLLALQPFQRAGLTSRCAEGSPTPHIGCAVTSTAASAPAKVRHYP
jgi:hypothetical protein